MVSSEEYYNALAEGYDNLYKEEQLKKINIIKSNNFVHKNDYLLDVGCGTGFSLDLFEVKKAIGIDPSKELIKQYSGEQKIILGSAENLPFDNNSFDVVISITAIQNFTDIKKGLEEILRVGKNRFVITTLKKSTKHDLIIRNINSVFNKKEFEIVEIDEGKDTIFFIKKIE